MLGPWQISSVVQNRGSIPLFWSQETSKLNLKPDIILHEKDKNYEATRLHFENLRKRYGNPIIILNLIKVSTLMILTMLLMDLLHTSFFFSTKGRDVPLTSFLKKLVSRLEPGLAQQTASLACPADQLHLESVGSFTYKSKVIHENHPFEIYFVLFLKTLEKRPREIILRWEFDRAIKIINSGLPGEDHLRFLHWDLHKNSQSKSTNALQVLLKVAFEALNMTEFFYCQVSPDQRAKGSPNLSPTLKIGFGHHACDDKNCGNADYVDDLDDISQEDTCGSSDPGNGIAEDKFEVNGSAQIKRPKFQKGVLRTNCIDCLDRTNVAQYAYGLAALGHQLHALGSVESPEVHLDSPLSRHLMHFYERMGDTLALQYGGSAAHNKVLHSMLLYSSICQKKTIGSLFLPQYACLLK
ncbi:Phosphoinositide phosphatase SAC2 [Zea mays]|uniref:Phosphoinositide phosphatase SAC2 n=1 Tax=Zea mays TaxID=4577 RepID=A0A1D6NT41_MAIZE|nr:Phosphoinositide phosphatase SAC2 [Zea mays]